ncbi:MAG: hypothetical protein EP340_04030 [Alphaproteobacteria bacterium]|nr:MAG: hypothetical protein EP340_04030 [Alphaproteobacteria bacterium]
MGPGDTVFTLRGAMMVDPLFHIAVRLVLAIILGAAIVHKLKDLAALKTTVQHYGVLPARLVPLGAWSVVAGEVFVLALIVFGPAVHAGVAAALLFGFYGGIIWRQLMTGRTAFDCGCSWIKSASLSADLCIRNIILVVVSLALCLPQAVRDLSVFDLINAGLFACVTAGLYFLVDALIHMKQLEASR